MATTPKTIYNKSLYTLLTTACIMPLMAVSAAYADTNKKAQPSVVVHLEVLDSLARAEAGYAAPVPVPQSMPKSTQPVAIARIAPQPQEAPQVVIAKPMVTDVTQSARPVEQKVAEGGMPWQNPVLAAPKDSKKDAPEAKKAATAKKPAKTEKPAEVALEKPVLPWQNPALATPELPAPTQQVAKLEPDTAAAPEARSFEPLKAPEAAKPAPKEEVKTPEHAAPVKDAKHGEAKPEKTHKEAAKPVEKEAPKPPVVEAKAAPKMPEMPAMQAPATAPEAEQVVAELPAAPEAPVVPAAPEMPALPAPEAATPPTVVPAEVKAEALPEVPAPVAAAAPLAPVPVNQKMPEEGPPAEAILPVVAASPDIPKPAQKEDDSWFPGLKKQIGGIFGGDDETPAPQPAAPEVATAPQAEPPVAATAPALPESATASAAAGTDDMPPSLPATPEIAAPVVPAPVVAAPVIEKTEPKPVAKKDEPKKHAPEVASKDEKHAAPEAKKEPAVAKVEPVAPAAPALPELPPVAAVPAAPEGLPELPATPALPEPSASAAAPALPPLPEAAPEVATAAPAPVASLPPLTPITGEVAAPTKVEEVKAAELPPVAAADPVAAPKAAPTQLASATPTSDSGAAPKLQIVFKETETEVPLSVKSQISDLANSIKADANARITIVAFAAGSEEQASTAKRVSLSRALAVRAALIEQGIDNLRINVEVGGNKAGGGPADRVDVFLKQGKAG